MSQAETKVIVGVHAGCQETYEGDISITQTDTRKKIQGRGRGTRLVKWRIGTDETRSETLR
jgi:hypothetical protein